jgi:hypothetical protein
MKLAVAAIIGWVPLRAGKKLATKGTKGNNWFPFVLREAQAR